MVRVKAEQSFTPMKGFVYRCAFIERQSVTKSQPKNVNEGKLSHKMRPGNITILSSLFVMVINEICYDRLRELWLRQRDSWEFMLWGPICGRFVLKA